MKDSQMEEIRERFRVEAVGHLREAEKLLKAYSSSPNPQTLDDACRHFHALKGSSPLVGARPVSEVARTVEACLKHVMSEPHLFTADLERTLHFAITLIQGQIDDFAAGQPIREGKSAVQTIRSHMPASQSIEELLRNLELMSQELRNSLGETLQSVVGRELDEGRRLYVLHIPPHKGMQEELPRIRSAIKGYGTILSVAGRDEGSIHLLLSSTHPAPPIQERLKGFQSKLTELVTRTSPPQQKPRKPMGDSSPPPRKEGKFRILFSDDSQIARDLHRILLQRNGYEVEVAQDGEEALQMLKNSHFDAVITDDQMPGMDGIEVLHLTREDEELQKIPFIVMSGHATEEARQRAMDGGASAYLVKGDFEKEELLVLLRQAIEKGPGSL